MLDHDDDRRSPIGSCCVQAARPGQQAATRRRPARSSDARPPLGRSPASLAASRSRRAPVSGSTRSASARQVHGDRRALLRTEVARPSFCTHAWMRLAGREVHDDLHDRARRRRPARPSPGRGSRPACPCSSSAHALGPDHDLHVAAGVRVALPGDELEVAELTGSRRRARPSPSRPSGSTRRGSRRRRRSPAPRRPPSGVPTCSTRPLRHHGDAVGHRERLLLVVRDVDERDADLLLQRLQLDLQRLAELGVQSAERLVEQEHRGVQDRRGPARRAAAGRRTAASGRRFSKPVSCTSSSASPTRRFDLLPWTRPLVRRPNATFSATVRWGNSA